MKDKQQILQYGRPFCDLFTDAIRHLNVALSHAAPADLRNAASKSCILHCVLSLEAVANSLLADLDYSSRLRESTDRFQPIEKFEFALYHMSDKILDRGSREVQSIAEMLKLRNEYVHPKVQKRSGNFTEEPDTVDFEDAPWPTIDIPREPRRWIYEHAKKVVIATDKFLEYFFLELCGLTVDRTTSILLPVLELESLPRLVFVVENHKMLKHARDNMSVPISYLDLDRPFDGFINDHYGSGDSA